MRTEDQLYALAQAVHVLDNMPAEKLAASGTLIEEMKKVLNTPYLQSIVNNIANDQREMRDAMFSQNSKQKKGLLNPESMEFMGAYTRYQSAAFNVLSEKKPARYTSVMGKKHAMAFNAKNHKHPMSAKYITTLPETKRFIEAFNSTPMAAKNSIWSDKALQIGTPQDPTMIGSYIDYTPYIYNYQYYLGIPTLAQSIDFPLAAATKEEPDIVFKDRDLSRLIEEDLRKERFIYKARKAMFYSRMSPRGALMVPIENDDGTIRFNVFNDTQFTYATSYQYQSIDFQDNDTGVSQLFCLGHILQNEVTAHFTCPGFEPIYAIGKNYLYQLKGAAEAVNIYLYTIKVLCIRAQVITSKWSGEGQSDTKVGAMINMLNRVSSRLSLNTAVPLPDDAELNILNNNFNEGFAKVSPIIKEYQGALMGVTGEHIYGSENASYSANNFNGRISNMNIRSQYQEEMEEPIYRFAVRTKLERDVRYKKWRQYANDFEVKHKPLYEMTEPEKAEADQKKIQNLVAMRQAHADYPDILSVFKDEGLIPEEYNFKNGPPTKPPTET